MIIRALQLAFIILAIAVIYPFYGREPVLFPKDTATPDGFVRTLKADRLAQVLKEELKAEEEKPDKEKIVLASLPPAEQKAQPPAEQAKAADDRPFFSARSTEASHGSWSANCVPLSTRLTTYAGPASPRRQPTCSSSKPTTSSHH